MDGRQLYFDNFTPVGDVSVIALCLVMIVLIITSHINKNKTFGLLVNMIVYLILAAVCDIIHHQAYISIHDGNYLPVYIFRFLSHVFLFSILLLYVVYTVVLMNIKGRGKKISMIAAIAIYAIVLLGDGIAMVAGTGFRIDGDGIVHRGINFFMIGYLAFIVELLVLIGSYRKQVYRKVFHAFAGTMLISFFILFNQGRHGVTAFTVLSFLLPVIAMLYIVHSSPYDIRTGTLSVSAMKNMISFYYARKQPFRFLSLYLPELQQDGKSMSEELQATIRYFSTEFFTNASLFRISGGHMVLLVPEMPNSGYKKKFRSIMEAFDTEYERFHLDYKMVIGESIDSISEKNEYIGLIQNIHRNMDINTKYTVTEKDVESFHKTGVILEELQDIFRKHDLDDPRVLVYCQPVYNIGSGRYDTAEALMRLKLDGLGMVFPDQFIHVAEEYGFIHVLTEIILKKTCDEIGRLLSEGYYVKRISVNVSVAEFRDEKFISDIDHIITSSRIPNEKVAIEITESYNDSDFMLLKTKVGILKEKGIMLYLDDFGTGYSNMERILELPFDIIKFDRSLVLASDSDKRSEKMVRGLADMLAQLDYAILYEGIENENDERRCIDMSAQYLQGYKYSRPIPIGELRNFFAKCA